MRGLKLIVSLTALLVHCGAFRLGSSQHVVPLCPPAAPLVGDGSPAQSRFIQELVRTKRYLTGELVRAQPHLVHDMGWPEIHETSRSQTKVESVNSSQTNTPPTANQEVARTFSAADESPDVQDVMERMVHLAAPQDPEVYQGHLDPADPESELLGGPGAGDASQEASGFYGTDAEDRERGEEGGEDQEKRGEEEWETDLGEDKERREEDEDKTREEINKQRVPEVSGVNHTTPDLDALIGYTSSFHPFKEPSSSVLNEERDSGLQEHRGAPVLEQVGPLGRDPWEAEKDRDSQSSGYGLLHPSISTAYPTAPAAGSAVPDVSADFVETATPETDTGTDFGLLGSFTRDETEEEETGVAHTGVITQNPTAPEVGSAPSREPLQPSLEEEERWERGFGMKDKIEAMEEEKMGGEERRILPIIPLTTDPSPTTESNQEEPRQVVCLNWSELAGRGYVVLNMTKNMNCEEFRVCQGARLLKIIERVFSRRMNTPEGSWVIYLSKPTHQQHQLLMNVASGHGVIDTQDVLNMLGEIRKSLDKVGIQNYSAATTCQSRPSKTRSDYGKLFVVLVIIGAVCMIIITSGFIYICWQRRLPAVKTMFPAEELHSVENGYHDNPTLDVTNDGQPEMQEKKPSTNGLAAMGGGGGADSSRWQAFVNQAVTEDDEEEQDTHL